MTDKIDTSWKWGYSYFGLKLRYIGVLNSVQPQYIWAVCTNPSAEYVLLTDEVGCIVDSGGYCIKKNPAPKVRMWTWVRHFPGTGRTMCVGDLYSDEDTAMSNRPAQSTYWNQSELLGPFPIEVEGVE